MPQGKSGRHPTDHHPVRAFAERSINHKITKSERGREWFDTDNPHCCTYEISNDPLRKLVCADAEVGKQTSD